MADRAWVDPTVTKDITKEATSTSSSGASWSVQTGTILNMLDQRQEKGEDKWDLTQPTFSSNSNEIK
jgi:hypothetical protein